MKSAAEPYSSWPRSRFLGVMGVLFALQAGLLFLLGNHSIPRATPSTAPMGVRSLGASFSDEDLWRQFFVGDPAAFPLANHEGFSGRAWLDYSPLEPPAETQLEAANPLGLDPSRLGTNFPVLPATSEPIPAAPLEEMARHQEPMPMFLTPEILAPHSGFRLTDGLRDRLLGAEPVLPEWPSAKALTYSSVQIAVGPTGEVVATRLDANCGLAEADTEAVVMARSLRFRPAPSEGTQWGEAVFQWQTSELPTAGQPK
jgi:hypothetical protein